MFIKFKFNNTTRKIKKEVKTIEELKEQSLKVFGNDVVYCDIMYEDEDNELVNIIDDEDLTTAYEEAQENGKKCVKIVLELSSPKTKRARSISQKKKMVAFVDESEEELVGFGSSDEDLENLEGFSDEIEAEIEAEIDAEEVGEEAVQNDPEVEQIINDKFNRLEEKMQKKLSKLEEKRKRKLWSIKNGIHGAKKFFGKMRRKHHRRHGGHKRHGGRHGRHHRGPHHRGPHHPHHPPHHRGPHHRGPHHRRRGHSHSHSMSSGSLSHSSRSHSHHRGKMPQFVKEIIEENKKHGHPWRQLKEIMHSVKDEFKTFRGSPALIAKAVEKSKGHILEYIKNTIEEVKNENPELMAELDKKREERAQKKEERKAEGKCRKERKRLCRQRKREEKLARKEEKLAKKQVKKEEKEAKKEASPKKEVMKESSPEASPKKGVNKERRQEIKNRVNIIQPIFKDMKRPDIRKEVVSDLDAGNDVQVTIKRLFQN